MPSSTIAQHLEDKANHAANTFLAQVQLLNQDTSSGSIATNIVPASGSGGDDKPEGTLGDAKNDKDEDRQLVNDNGGDGDEHSSKFDSEI